MSKPVHKHNSSGHLKKRNELGNQCDGKSYSQLINFSSVLPKERNFVQKDLGNGFRKIIPKK